MFCHGEPVTVSQSNRHPQDLLPPLCLATSLHLLVHGVVTQIQTASLLDELVVHNEDDGRQQQQYDGASDELVGGDAARHVGQNAARFCNVIIGSMKCVARMADGLPLSVEILQDADSQLLRTALSCQHE